MSEQIQPGPSPSSPPSDAERAPVPDRTVREPERQPSSEGWDRWAWLAAHGVSGAVMAVGVVVLFRLAGPDGFDLKHPRPFPPWKTGGAPLFGVGFGLAVGLCSWRRASTQGRRSGPAAVGPSILVLLVLLLFLGFVYGYLAARATPGSLRAEIAADLPLGTSKGAVLNWVGEQHSIRMHVAPTGDLFGGSYVNVVYYGSGPFAAAGLDPSSWGGAVSITFRFDRLDRLESYTVTDQ